MSGFVESREERERSDRIVLRVTAMEGARLTERPERIRLTVRKGSGARGRHLRRHEGADQSADAPLRPGGYDLARDLYFQGIGATGMVLGAIRPAAPRSRAGLAPAVRHRGRSDPRRHRARIRAAIPGDAGAIASALITGKRDAMSGSVFDAMFISGVGHVLSVSG